MNRVRAGLLCLLPLCFCLRVFSQALPDSSTLGLQKPLHSTQYISEVDERSAALGNRLATASDGYLEKLQGEERTLRGKLQKIDPNAAGRIFRNSEETYDKLRAEVKSNSDKVLQTCGKYLPGIDTAVTSLKFLSASPAWQGMAGGKITQALASVNRLKDEFTKADNVEDFIRQRQAYLSQQLANFPLGNSLGRFRQDAYYYSQTVADVKEAWNDLSKIEARAMRVLEKLPAYQTFLKKYSFLAGLFDVPEDYGTTGIPAGLQTRDQVEGLMQQAFTTLGPSGAQTAQANMLDAQSALTTLRSRLAQTGSGEPLPDFTPNHQKTKTFLRRIEYGLNLTSTKSSSYFPTETDLSVTAGYRLDDKRSVGVGLGYKIGWGRDIRHIDVTSQGVDIRSYVNWLIKKGFYATGGFELNHQTAFGSWGQFRRADFWQRSGLVGIMKSVPVRSKFFKNTNVSVLWDFLSYAQIPKPSPIKFRVGYNF